MKTIVCFHGRQRYPDAFNYHLHIGFLEKAFPWHGYRLVHHGPTGGTVPFEPTTDSLRRCVAKEQPCAVIIVERKSSRWAIDQVPQGVPVIVYSVDLYTMRGSVECYAGADVVLLRAKVFEQEICRMRGASKLGICRWIPFSVDMDIVDTVKALQTPREDKVAVCGDVRQSYQHRKELAVRLRDAGLLARWSVVAKKHRHKVPFADYVARLKSVLISAASTGVMYEGRLYPLNMAKHLEVPASGAMLMTNGGPGMDELLPQGLYLQFDDVDDAMKKARAALEQRAQTLELAQRASEHVRKHHSDRARADQLIGWLRREVGI